MTRFAENSYIKYTKENGEVVVKKLNFLNKNSYRKEISSLDNYTSEDVFYIRDEIREVLFSHVHFSSDIGQVFRAYQGQKLVFHDCTFHGERIEFYSGDVILIEPIFSNAIITSLFGRSINHCYLKMPNEGTGQNVCLYFTGGDISVLSNPDISNMIMTDCSSIELRKMHSMGNLMLGGGKIRFAGVNDFQVDTVLISGEEVDLGEDFSVSAVDQIDISPRRSIHYSKFSLNSKEMIRFGRDDYYPKDDKGAVLENQFLDSSHLLGARRALISTLKGLRGEINGQIDAEVHEMQEDLEKKLQKKKRKLLDQKIGS